MPLSCAGSEVTAEAPDHTPVTTDALATSQGPLMGRKLNYRPGGFYRVDDRTGFAQRAGRTRKEWNGLIVDATVWEARQPQDLVRAVQDRQSVPEARPLSPNAFVGPIATQLTGAVAPRATFLPLVAPAGFVAGDALDVVQADGSWFRCIALAVGDNGADVDRPVPLGAPSGNLVYDMNPGGAFATHEFVFQGSGGSYLIAGPGTPYDWEVV